MRQFGVEALDFGIPKPTPEIILNAYGFGKYAVEGRTAVSVSINNVRKDLWVTGDRYWSGGRPSRALPFERIAISWRNAYGGPGFERNPQGKGYCETEINGARARFLPNIEDPAHPIVHEGQQCVPAGYSAIPIETPGRNLMLGTYDDHWRVHEFPGFAKDINWEYFNQSPPRQRLSRLAAGDEIVFTHLHPDTEILTTSVPPIVTRAFVKKEGVGVEEAGFLEEVPLKLTTYWAYPHLKKAILLYQGAVPVSTDDASDISHILYAVEQEDTAQSLAYYESVFHQRVGPESGPLYALLDKQLVDSRLIRKTTLDEIAISPLLRNKLRKLEKELAQTASHPEGAAQDPQVEAELAWLGKAQNGKMAREDVIEEMLKRMQQDVNLRALRKQRRKPPKRAEQALNDESRAAKAERALFLQSNRTALLASLRQDVEKKLEVATGSDTMASGATQDQLRHIRLEQLDAFEQMIDSAPDGNRARRLGAGGTARRYRIYGLNQIQTEPLPEGYDGYALQDFTANRTSYAGWNLRGIVVSDSRLSDCDFKKSHMTYGDFDRVVFQGCDFSSADWTRASFSRCEFIDCRLPGVQSDKARFEGCRFVRSELSAWIHFRITMRACTFQHCRFVNFSYMRGRLEHLDFESCFFLRHGFSKGKIAALRMLACQIDSMSFTGLETIQGLNLSQCQASKLYVAPETTLRDIDIAYCTISASSFRKIHLVHGAIAASDLSSCDFSETAMRDMRLEDSFFKRSLFIRADLSLARIKNADFSEAQMKSADVTGARMQHVSFFSADLSMIKADAWTIQQDMLMERSNVYPLRK